MLLVRQSAADGSRRAITDAAAARVPEPLIGLVEVPEATGPAAEIARVVAGDERPVFVLDLAPELRGQPRGADRACVPRVAGVDARAIGGDAALLREPGGALLEHALAI